MNETKIDLILLSQCAIMNALASLLIDNNAGFSNDKVRTLIKAQERIVDLFHSKEVAK